VHFDVAFQAFYMLQNFRPPIQDQAELYFPDRLVTASMRGELLDRAAFSVRSTGNDPKFRFSKGNALFEEILQRIGNILKVRRHRAEAFYYRGPIALYQTIPKKRESGMFEAIDR
jgi:hypothetical protein